VTGNVIKSDKILKICVKNFFCKILKMSENYYEMGKLFLVLFYTVQREDAHR